LERQKLIRRQYGKIIAVNPEMLTQANQDPSAPVEIWSPRGAASPGHRASMIVTLAIPPLRTWSAGRSACRRSQRVDQRRHQLGA